MPDLDITPQTGRGRDAGGRGGMARIASGRLYRDMWLSPNRPFFALSALWAVIAILVWHVGLRLGLPVPSLGTTTLWHAHEMTVGVGGAAMAAYFLTVMPSWTGARRVTGWPLIGLVALWALARLAALLAETLPLPLVLAPGLAFYALFTGLYLRAIVSQRRWDRWAVPAVIAFLGLADAAFVATALGALPWPGEAEMTRVLVLFFATKVSVIAGNMAPAFTAGWLAPRGRPLPRIDPLASRIGLALMLLAFPLTLAGPTEAAAAVLIAAGAAQLWRIRRWKSLAAARYAPALMLHLAFAWLPLGLVLTGLAALLSTPWREADAIHALMMGAMAGLAMSIASRAAARREGGALRIGPVLGGAFALIWAAAGLRLAAPLMPAAYEPLLDAAAAVWCAGWGMFLVAYMPGLRGPVANPVFNVGGHGHGKGPAIVPLAAIAPAHAPTRGDACTQGACGGGGHGHGRGGGCGGGCGCGGHGHGSDSGRGAARDPGLVLPKV
ncbi:NnrS family protein [Rhodovulum euryhalinum]|uniref:Uncharacterized protein involved in response to NO n=1 Tax=Rhodovulum euryhalinum TaxID=35805 RepID=A0A4R2KI06_9RHOB|nr:NnrS family protein [Rhodovulum euryhalinum]TCO73253.1 uncharacterized protein involved in response to NO [Rhodovulum euryhalinum]